MKHHLRLGILPTLLFSNSANAVITGVTESGRGGDAAAVIASGFAEDGAAFSDRSHEHNGAAFSGSTLNTSGGTVVPLPDYLVGGDYVRFANNARDNDGYSAVVTSDVSSNFYLLIDNRLDGPAGRANNSNSSDPVLGGTLQWVIDGGWERVDTGISPGGQPDYTGVDEGGNGNGAGAGLNQFYAVYKLAGLSNVTVRNNGTGGSNMIALVAVPAGAGGGPDSDNDGLPDVWELENFGDLDEDDSGDFDNDGLTNLEEFNLNTDPTDEDSDDDELRDGDEVNIHETDPTDADSDDDTLQDGAEINTHSTDPNASDSDGDALSDAEEINTHSTNPNLADSDDDGFDDGVEVSRGSDPNDDASVPDFSELSEVVINEFLASNDGTLQDEDGDFSDWIELWNPGDGAVEIGGWHLSDDAENSAKWTFPALSIPAKGFLVIFASSKDRAVAGSELHTNFSLSKSSGSHLSLSRPDGAGGVEVISAFDAYDKQFEDISFGFFGDDEPLLSGYFETPTPGAANGGTALAGFVKDTVFSMDRGIYDAAFEVEVTSETPGASIIFTTDGTLPRESPLNGTRVNAPDSATGPSASVNITTTTNLRALAVKAGFGPTNVDTHSYLFPSDILQQSNATVPPHANWGHAGPDFEMDPDIVNHANPEVRPAIEDFRRVPTISLTMNWDEMFGNNGIYLRGESVQRETSIEYFNPESSLTEPNLAKGFQVDGTVQIAGGSSTGRWKSDKLSMRLKFSPDLRFPVFGDERTDRFDTLVIDNRLNNVWHYNPGSGAGPGQAARAQYTHDQFPADLHNLMGGLSPEGRHCLLYINGVLWGVTELHERPDDNFAAEYLGGDNSEYDAMKHRTSTVVAGSNANYLAMLNLSRQDMAVQENYEEVVSVLHIDNFIYYMISNYYVGNTDWAHQNWYATFGRDRDDGKWYYHSWDPEHCMESTTTNNTEKNDNGGPTEIFRNLIVNSEFRLRFADAVQRHFHNDGVLTPENAAAAYLRRADAVDFVTRIESARWGDNGDTVRDNPYDRLDWLRVRDQLLGTVGGGAWGDYFPRRTGIVLGQFNNRGWYPDTDAPVFSQNGGSVPIGVSLAMTSPDGGTIYYTIDGSDPRETVSGAVSGNAQTYSSAVALTSSAQYRARVLKSGEWSAVTEATFIVGTVPADVSNLVVSEINYRPGEPDAGEIAAGFDSRTDFEFIELTNISSSNTIDLTGVVFTGGVDFDFDNDSSIFELAPGASLIIAENREAFAMRYGAGPAVVGVFQNSTQLSNGGEVISLSGGDLSEIRSFKYEDEFPWPGATDGDGFTLTLIDPFSNPNHALATSWRSSVAIGGSPGGSDATNYTIWAASFGENLAPDDDADGDGFVNLLEYGLASSPLSRDEDGSLFSVSLNFTTVNFRKNKSADDLVLQAEFSTDLIDWEPAVEYEKVNNGDGSETVTAGPPAAMALASRRFVRLRASIKFE